MVGGRSHCGGIKTVTGHRAGVRTVVAGVRLPGPWTVGLSRAVAMIVVLISGCSGAEFVVILSGLRAIVIAVVAVVIILVISLTWAEAVVIVVVVSLTGAEAVVVIIISLTWAETVVFFFTRIMLIVIGCTGA